MALVCYICYVTCTTSIIAHFRKEWKVVTCPYSLTWAFLITGLFADLSNKLHWTGSEFQFHWKSFDFHWMSLVYSCCSGLSLLLEKLLWQSIKQSEQLSLCNHHCLCLFCSSNLCHHVIFIFNGSSLSALLHGLWTLTLCHSAFIAFHLLVHVDISGTNNAHTWNLENF